MFVVCYCVNGYYVIRLMVIMLLGYWILVIMLLVNGYYVNGLRVIVRMVVELISYLARNAKLFHVILVLVIFFCFF